jgi:integrase
MARTATGVVVEDTRRRSPTFGLRFQAYGKRRYVTLGSREDGWTQAKAERELQHILADVERGKWQPIGREIIEAPREMPTFHEFASEWFERQKVEGGRRGGGLTAAGVADLEWRLSVHLLPFFKSIHVDAITVEDVDRYRLAKVKAGKLNATSINKTLQVLSAVLEAACEYGHVSRNVAQGRRRRLPSVTPPRTSLDRAEHVTVLLDAAAELDAEAGVARPQRRALLAVLTLAGLRISEALALCWRDVDLARGTLKVRQGKTAAAARTVNVLPVLGHELTAYRARVDDGPDALVFGTRTGKRQNPSNVSKRMLTKAVDRANATLAKTDTELMPRLTPHSLRRTFASLLYALGETPPYVMGQMGHTSPNLALAIYAREMNRRDGEPERLKALVEGGNWQRIGSSANVVDLSDRNRRAA